MKLDNLFVVESPLQALVALELSLQFSDQKNGVIYRLSGTGRERNDQQILNVLERGNWDYIHPTILFTGTGLVRHWRIRATILDIKMNLNGNVGTLFFGEFRSQWMHFVRAVISAQQNVLMDDGASTITAKRNYLDKLIYYPLDHWKSNNRIKDLVKKVIYSDIEIFAILHTPVLYASAFVGDASDYLIDFSHVKSNFHETRSVSEVKTVLYFGSKYSESGIVSRLYELEFISSVKNFYDPHRTNLIYCAHRDESTEKLNQIQSRLGILIEKPELPAELHLLNYHSEVSEVAAAYSSVLNNIHLMFPEKSVRSFLMKDSEIVEKYRKNIADVYEYFNRSGIHIERNF